MRDLVIFGDKNFAEVARYYFEHDSEHRVRAFTVDGEFLAESTRGGLPVVPFEELPSTFPPSDYGMFVAVGIADVNRARAAKVAQAEARGYRLASFLSSKAAVHSDLELQPNTMIMEGAVIQPFVRIGKNSVLWSTTRIGFRTRVGNHCWIVCALFGESVVMKDYGFVGLGATVGPNLTLGESCVVGAAALVLKDTPDRSVYRGPLSEHLEKSSDALWRSTPPT